jgi:hypothetical protein
VNEANAKFFTADEQRSFADDLNITINEGARRFSMTQMFVSW